MRSKTQPIRINRPAAAAAAAAGGGGGGNGNGGSGLTSLVGPLPPPSSSEYYESAAGGLFSQSLGAHPPGGGGMMMNNRKVSIHRHLSDVSTISYAGYLLKRSNRPHRHHPHAAAAATTASNNNNLPTNLITSPFPPPSSESYSAAEYEYEQKPAATATAAASAQQSQSQQQARGVVFNRTTATSKNPPLLQPRISGQAGGILMEDHSSSSHYSQSHLHIQHQRLPQHLMMAVAPQTQQTQQQESSAAAHNNMKMPAREGTKPKTTQSSMSHFHHDSAFDHSLAFASSFFGVDLKGLESGGGGSANNNNNNNNNRGKQPKSPPPPQPPELAAPSTPNNNNNNNGSLGDAADQLLFGRAAQGNIIFNNDLQSSFNEKRRASAPAATTTTVSMKTSFSRSNSDCNSHPPDDVDADGHTWRAKYCVLESNILYFYRYKTDAEAPEAHIERQHHALHDLDDNNNDNNNNNNNPISTAACDFTTSPIPTKAYSMIAGSYGGGAGTGGVGGGGGTSMDHLNTWEKFIALNSVGAVRSAEGEYGSNSFELSAADDTSEKLILRARNQEEMNEWLFQFHRSIASYVMDIMECASSVTKLAMDIHHPTFSHRPLAPIGDPSASPEQQHPVITMAAYSPHFQKGLTPLATAAAMTLTPNLHHATTPSLSHGHGRNSLHRRRMELSGALQVQNRYLNRMNSPRILSADTAGVGGSDSQQQQQQQHSPVTPIPFLPQQPHDSPGGYTNLRHRMVVTPTPREQMRAMEDVSPELSAPQSDYPETERPPPTKPGKKYVPPHLRRAAAEAEAAASAAAANGSTSCSDGASATTPPPPQKYVPPHLRNKTATKHVATTPPPGTMYASSPQPHSYFTVREEEAEEGEDGNDADKNDNNGDELSMFFVDDNPDVAQEEDGLVVRLGGCADPNLVDGSILDEMYIPRKASRLDKTRASLFGCTYNTKPIDVPETSNNGSSHGGLRWEIGAVSECGVRDSNEDAYLIVSDVLAAFEEISPLSSSSSSPQTVWDVPASTHTPCMFAVFDGHCGDHAARFAAESLIRFVHEQSSYRDALMKIDVSTPGGLDEFKEILREAVSNLDNEFCNICVDGGRDWESGATALIAALVNEHVVIANLGDARGVLSRSVEDDTGARSLESSGWSELPSGDCSGNRRCFWKQITDVHSPSRDDERARIEEANGWITTEKEIPVGQLQRMVLFDQDVVDILKRCFSDRIQPSPKAAAPQRILHISRVCGELAVSRAIGDRDFKAAFNSQREPTIHHSGQPEWDSSLFLPYPEDHSQSFVGDLVSNEAEFQSTKVGEPGSTDEFLLLACDGLWDVMDADDAVRLTRDLLFEKGWPAKFCAQRLAELAIHLGSSDNITVIVVRFCDRTLS